MKATVAMTKKRKLYLHSQKVINLDSSSLDLPNPVKCVYRKLKARTLARLRRSGPFAEPAPFCFIFCLKTR